MFSAFSLTETDSAEMKDEINRNSYTLPIPIDAKITTNAKIHSKSFHGKSSRSFYGCTECKLRKKKCDELKPSCSSCIKRNVSCVYNGNIFKRKPNPSYVVKQALVICEVRNEVHDEVRDEDIDPEIAAVPQMTWSSSSSASPQQQVSRSSSIIEEQYNELDAFLSSVLSDFPYTVEEDISQRAVIDTTEIAREEEVMAMDESQVIRNIESKDKEDDLLLRFILNVRSHVGGISDEELSKYVSSVSVDFVYIKEALFDFLLNRYDYFTHLDELDKFYLSSFMKIYNTICTMKSSHEPSFSELYFELGQKDDAILHALVSLGAGFISYQGSDKVRSSLKKSLEIYSGNLSKFVHQKQKKGEVDYQLAISITTSLTLYCHIGILLGNTKEWLQYNQLLGKFIITHFGSLVSFVNTFKTNDPLMTKAITTNIFTHSTLLVSTKKCLIKPQDMIDGLIASRIHSYNEFDSIMSYCTGLFIIIAQIKDYTDKKGNDDTRFKQFDELILKEKPNPSPDNEGFSDEEFENHLTLFELEQTAARIFLRLMFDKLDPAAEETIDLLLNTFSCMKVLIKTKFESMFSFPLLMAGIACNDQLQERVVRNVIAFVRSHNQTANTLRVCMFLEEMYLFDTRVNKLKLYRKVVEHLNWDISICI